MGQKPFIIGLTGNIATGKSTVLRYLAARGAHVIDADRLTHQAMEPGGLAYQAIVDSFGAGVIAADGRINRTALGQVVFGDVNALQRLEQIVHPAVFELARAEIASTTAPIIVIEAIKLIEAQRLARLCDEIWVVTASPQTQLRRLREQRGMAEAEARKRMAAQSSQEVKSRHADRVIDNDGDLEQLQRQLDALWSQLEQKLVMRDE
jgi:dephospho-CoA kinase